MNDLQKTNYKILSTRTSKRYRIYKHIARLAESEPNSISNKFPISVEIFPTNKCNINCKFCSYKKFIDKEVLENKVFNRLIDEIISNNVKSVTFSGGGEPTLHDFLPIAIEKLTNSNVKVGLITNGVTIHKDLLSVLNKCSWIRISLNANSKESYFNLTGNSELVYERITTNIEKIVNNRSPNLIVGISILVNNFLKDDYIKSISIASDLAVDQIFFKPLLNGFTLDENKHYAAEYKDEIVLYSRKNKIVTNINKFIASEINKYMLKDKYTDCPIVDNNLVGLISANGNVHPCIYQYTNSTKISYGNLNNRSLYSIYFNREDVVKKIKTSKCNFCKYGHVISEIYDFENSKFLKNYRDPHADFI